MFFGLLHVVPNTGVLLLKWEIIVIFQRWNLI